MVVRVAVEVEADHVRGRGTVRNASWMAMAHVHGPPASPTAPARRRPTVATNAPMAHSRSVRPNDSTAVDHPSKGTDELHHLLAGHVDGDAAE